MVQSVVGLVGSSVADAIRNTNLVTELILIPILGLTNRSWKANGLCHTIVVLVSLNPFMHLIVCTLRLRIASLGSNIVCVC